VTTQTLGGPRRFHGLLPPKPGKINVNGKPIKFRFVQSVAHGSLIGFAGVLLFAGLYFAVVEVPWHISMLGIHTGTSLIKSWWDGGMGFIHSGSWYLYRHAIRNDGEPAAFALFGSMLAAPPKYWGKKIGTVRLILTPPLLLLVTGALIIAGTYAIIHWAPANWSYSTLSIILGLLIGFAMRPLWKPVGAVLQGYLVDHAVDVARGKGKGYTPLWVRTPLGPPAPRERYSEMRANHTDTETRSPASKGLIVAFLTASFVLIVLGGMAKFGFNNGWHLWYFYPASMH
jgi:hypothetical protein